MAVHLVLVLFNCYQAGLPNNNNYNNNNLKKVVLGNHIALSHRAGNEAVKISHCARGCCMIDLDNQSIDHLRWQALSLTLCIKVVLFTLCMQ